MFLGRRVAEQIERCQRDEGHEPRKALLYVLIATKISSPGYFDPYGLLS